VAFPKKGQAMLSSHTSSKLAVSVSQIVTFLCCVSLAAYAPAQGKKQEKTVNAPQPTRSNSELKVATFGGGCFWCVEAVFEEMKGVKDVVSGYAGGAVQNPTYQQVCTGLTGHAEVCQIHYNPEEVSFVELLEVFFKTHDPTTLNRQGPDIGTQYRSVIYYHDDEQKELAESYKRKLNEEKAYRKDVVTEISPLPEFYIAEPYHQDYFRNNPNQAYCAAVVRAKVQKARKVFKEMEAEAKAREAAAKPE
jgi:peptide-methionine (S)-S-oxide reductase